MARKADSLKAQMQGASSAAASYVSNQGPKETKSARTSFLLYPSVYRDFQTLADALNVSPSELLNTVMREYVNQRRDIIVKWTEYREAAAAAFKI